MRRYLEKSGQRNLPVTLDTQDWSFEPPWVAAQRAGDTAAQDSLAREYQSQLRLEVIDHPRGYAGPIGITLGIAPDGTIAGLAISKLDQTETPGLGVKVTLAAFRDQFRGKGMAAVRLKKDGGTIDAITAATISSRAVADGVRDALAWYGKNFPQGLGGQAGG